MNITKAQRSERALAARAKDAAAIITTADRQKLDMFGTLFANFSVDSPLPRAYEIVSQMFVLKGKPERNGYRHLLPHLEKLAANGLSAEQIARVLGMPETLLGQAVAYYPEIYHALSGGRARGINEAAATITANAAKGDTAAAKFKLQTVGGFTTKVQLVQSAPNTGQQEAPVKSDTTDTLKTRQQEIIDSIDFQELESV
jgi:hypothetical protein